MKITLVLPTLDRQAAVYNLLRHLEHQSRRPDETVVIDQTEARDPRLEAYPGIRYLRISRKGLPNARNVGVEHATGDAILFLDDDVIPDADLVRRHVENLEDPSIAGVGGRVLGGYDAPDPRAPVGTFRESDGAVIRNFGDGPRRDVQHLPGGNMSFRREVFAKIGGFDVAFGGSSIGEETDFCLRAVRAGFRLVYDPAASLEHLHLPTGGCRAPKFDEWLYWHAHNGMLFLLRHARRVAIPLFVVKRMLRFALFSIQHASPSLLLVGMHGLMGGASTLLRAPTLGMAGATEGKPYGKRA